MAGLIIVVLTLHSLGAIGTALALLDMEYQCAAPPLGEKEPARTACTTSSSSQTPVFDLVAEP
eukprot:673933-Lingulodinium_polyedra.AAC.1